MKAHDKNTRMYEFAIKAFNLRKGEWNSDQQFTS